MSRTKKPSGYCHNGHDQTKHGYIEITEDWRCRECRKISNRNRDYWKLVNRFIDNQDDQDALEKLQKFHWREP